MEVPLPEKLVTQTIDIMMDFCWLAEGISRLTVTIGRLCLHWGARASNLLLSAARIFNKGACILRALMITLDILTKYKPWKSVMDYLSDPDFLLNLADLAVTVAMATINLAGPVGWAIFVAVVAVGILKYCYDYIKSRWEERDKALEAVSKIMDELIPIREFVYKFNETAIEMESNYSARASEVAFSLAQDIGGEIGEDLKWASEYFADLSKAQLDFANEVRHTKVAIDSFLISTFHYDTLDGKKVRGHLEGINCTKGQYSEPGLDDFFTFTACVYHPSKNNPEQFIFTKHTIFYDEQSNSIKESFEEVDYSYISRSWWIVPPIPGVGGIGDREGWAWEVPIEKDYQGRTFAVTYTTDVSHQPVERQVNTEFYFDSGCQNYDPDSEFRDYSKIVPDPNTGKPSFFYHYKFKFDEGTTTEFLTGVPDALELWKQNIQNSLSYLENRIKSFNAAFNTLVAAFSRKKGMPLPIAKALVWLRDRQRSDGSWYGNWGTYVGVTSLVTLAFLNAGYDETDTTVRKAINYILRNVKSDGSIYSRYESRTYETSLALMALVATHNASYSQIIENAKNWLVNSQWDENCLWGSVSKDHWYYGGFGYGRN
ncbi:MAG TPA: hypothetical protein ENG10_01875, partial [Candidatus Bathyarchaeota archaeon]|nr:hypothetical protein [Candidatus Bathyarchaeota archaeon]HEX69030.1 hypothetical protein [Candidatus Bathyarchaeota archaeon]